MVFPSPTETEPAQSLAEVQLSMLGPSRAYAVEVTYMVETLPQRAMVHVRVLDVPGDHLVALAQSPWRVWHSPYELVEAAQAWIASILEDAIAPF